MEFLQLDLRFSMSQNVLQNCKKKKQKAVCLQDLPMFQVSI